MREPIPFPATDRHQLVDEAIATHSAPPETPARDRIGAIVRTQPSDSTYDDVMRELAFERLVGRGLDDLASGRLLATADVLKAFRAWRP